MSINFIKTLKHEGVELDFKTMSSILWYSPIHASYIQRDSLLDGTWVFTKTSDPYILFLFKRMFSANVTRYASAEECYKAVKEMNAFPPNTIGVYQANDSLLYAILEKLRNSIAHGTFNIQNSTIFGIGQVRNKQEACINLYYSFSLDCLKHMDDFHNAVKALSRLKENDLVSFSRQYLGAATLDETHFQIKGDKYCFENNTFQASRSVFDQLKNNAEGNKVNIYNDIKTTPTTIEEARRLRNAGRIMTVLDFITGLINEG